MTLQLAWIGTGAAELPWDMLSPPHFCKMRKVQIGWCSVCLIHCEACDNVQEIKRLCHGQSVGHTHLQRHVQFQRNEATEVFSSIHCN